MTRREATARHLPLTTPAAATAVSDVLDRLRASGLRQTPARRHVLQQLGASNQHYSADDLFASLPPALAGCDRSTIHRQLTQLQQAGIIHATPTAHAVTFGILYDTPHHHESCLRCGLTSDTSTDGDLSPAQLLVDVVTTVRFGVCPNCALRGVSAQTSTH